MVKQRENRVKKKISLFYFQDPCQCPKLNCKDVTEMLKIKLIDEKSFMEDNICDLIKLEYVQHNDTHYIFVLSVVNYEFKRRNKSYIFLVKTFDEVTKLMKNHKDCCLFNCNEKYNVL